MSRPKHHATQNARRRERRAKNLCRDCGQPAAWDTDTDLPMGQCEKHLEQGRKNTAAFRRRKAGAELPMAPEEP